MNLQATHLGAVPQRSRILIYGMGIALRRGTSWAAFSRRRRNGAIGREKLFWIETLIASHIGAVFKFKAVTVNKWTRFSNGAVSGRVPPEFS